MNRLEIVPVDGATRQKRSLNRVGFTRKQMLLKTDCTRAMCWSGKKCHSTWEITNQGLGAFFPINACYC